MRTIRIGSGAGYSGDRVDLSGTFVPAYQVNNLITHVPFVGMILGGGAQHFRTQDSAR